MNINTLIDALRISINNRMLEINKLEKHLKELKDQVNTVEETIKGLTSELDTVVLSSLIRK